MITLQELTTNTEEQSIEQAWIDLAEKRLEEVESGEASAIRWDEIKRRVTRKMLAQVSYT